MRAVLRHLAAVEDPRVARARVDALLALVMIALCGGDLWGGESNLITAFPAILRQLDVAGLRAIGLVEAQRRFPDGTTTQESRYHLFSTPLSAQRLLVGATPWGGGARPLGH